MNTNIIDKQSRIDMAEKFFSLLFEAVHERKFGYLWTKQDKATYPFAVSNHDERRQMAQKAIELNDDGKDVYFGVNLMDEAPARNARVKAEHVTMQTATVTDIDILGGEHTDPNKYPADFDTAKNFLPFLVSLTVDSGYGGHGYCIYSEPIPITDANRKLATERNKKFISVIRSRAGKFSKAVDGVGDLPRVLRVPGTYNYKLGRENAPLCRLVDINDVRFTPSDMDEKLNASIAPKEKSKQQQPGAKLIYDSKATRTIDDIDRALNMLAVIPVADLSREDWINVGMALKNNGNSVSDWEQWSRPDERYHAGECEKLWQGFNGSGLTIATIHDIAKRYGYQEPRRADKFDTAGAEEDEELRTQDTLKDCPANLRVPHNFIFDKNGIKIVVPAKSEKQEPKIRTVTRTPIIPTKIFTENISYTTRYELAYKIGKKWRRIEVDGRVIADSRRILELADKGILIEEAPVLAKFLTRIIAVNYDLLNQVQTYTRPGWHDDQFIYPSGSENYICRRDNIDYPSLFTTRGNADAWKQKFVEITAQGGTITRFVSGAAFAAPLLRVIKEPNIQVHLWGGSNFAKSPQIKLGLSAYGDPSEGQLFRTWDATAKNRLAMAAGFCDLPQALDETGAMSKLTENALMNDVFNFSAGIVNQANKRDGTVRATEKFRSVRISTGERPLLKNTAVRGEFKRVIEIHVTIPILDDGTSHDLHIFLEDNHGHYGRIWTDYIVKRSADIKKAFGEFCQELRERDPRLVATIEPQNFRAVATCAFAFMIFCRCIGVPCDMEIILADALTMLRTLPTTVEIADTARALEALKDFVVSRDKFFLHEVNSPEFNNEFTQPAQVCYGKEFKNGEYAFFKTELTKILEDELGFASADKLIAEWYDQNLLRHTTGERTYPTYINGKYRRTIRFVAGVFCAREQDDTGTEEREAE